MQTAQKQGQAVPWQRQVQPNGSQSQGQSQTQGDTMQYLDNVTKKKDPSKLDIKRCLDMLINIFTFLLHIISTCNNIYFIND